MYKWEKQPEGEASYDVVLKLSLGIHNTKRCVMHLSLNGTQARGRQNLSIFRVKSLNSSKILIFLGYHWDKQEIDFFFEIIDF